MSHLPPPASRPAVARQKVHPAEPLERRVRDRDDATVVAWRGRSIGRDSRSTIESASGDARQAKAVGGGAVEGVLRDQVSDVERRVPHAASRQAPRIQWIHTPLAHVSRLRRAQPPWRLCPCPARLTPVPFMLLERMYIHRTSRLLLVAARDQRADVGSCIREARVGRRLVPLTPPTGSSCPDGKVPPLQVLGPGCPTRSRSSATPSSQLTGHRPAPLPVWHRGDCGTASGDELHVPGS